MGVSASAETNINTEMLGVNIISAIWHVSTFAETMLMPFGADTGGWGADSEVETFLRLARQQRSRIKVSIP
jgi:hypothetical protein